jgi:glutamate-1-semialdehyde 2,1-aminomutase
MPHRVGLIAASDDFVNLLYRWTRANAALLVFDEVITFRSNYAGAQQWFDVRPDLTALGKIIGGGFPVGALAGRREVMAVMNPLAETLLFPHSGTYSANPITMVAGRVALELFDQGAVERLNRLAERARQQIIEAIKVAGISACVTGAGSMFRIHLKTSAPNNYREAYVGPAEAAAIKTLLDHAFEHGIMLINTCSGALSTPMGEQEIDTLSEVMLSGFRKLKNKLPSP